MLEWAFTFFDVRSKAQYRAYVSVIQLAGPCILINYSEDPFRQRFSAAHEIAHAIFDLERDDFVISFSQWDKEDLIEIRANTFASNFLIPPGLIKSIPIQKWDEASMLEWATKLMVNVEPFVIALKRKWPDQ